MNFGKAIQTVREKRGMSIDELAMSVGISGEFIRRVEAGENMADKQGIDLIIRVLNIPASVLNFLSLERSDIPPQKLEAFDLLSPVIGDLLDELLKPETEQP